MNVDSKISDLSIEDYLSEVATSITVIPDWLVEEEQLLGGFRHVIYSSL